MVSKVITLCMNSTVNKQWNSWGHKSFLWSLIIPLRDEGNIYMYIYPHIHITIIMKLTTYPWFGVNPFDEAMKNPFAIIFILQNKADKRIQETWICYTPYEQIKISSGSYLFFYVTLKYITQNCGPGTSYEFITENTYFSSYDKSKCNSQCVTALFVLHTLFLQSALNINGE